ncbi:uroporphyrinogen-III synthase [Microlunatus elymi]|uniref:Uroporphyrinogen-III synthase n=1 Tax=Microlunatus elymi TaxID=2596828 RepID=A0A516Q542_9ACTN|nr:uroporphyrinogen-III synthase [Microlunatus elymi]
MSSAQIGYSSDQLAGFTIGVTADRRSDDLIAALVRRGAEVLHAPTLRIVPAGEDDRLIADTHAVIEARPDIVLATTSYGFNGWMDAADAAGLGPHLLEVLAGARILVRGPKARGAVRAAGLSEQGSGAEETTASLVDLVLDRGVDQQTVAMQLHGYVDQDQLDRLTEAGARLLTVAPYRWADPPDPRQVDRLIEAIVGRQLDVVTFTSAPAAEALLQAAERADQLSGLLAALAGDVLPIAVGTVTAAPLRRVGLNPVHPDRFRLGALVRTVCEQLEARVLHACTAVGSIELRGRRVVIAGAADHGVLLSPTGAMILKILINAEGGVVSKERLRELLPGVSDDHGLEVAIGRLRGSLGVSGMITTVVRRGYRLG